MLYFYKIPLEKIVKKILFMVSLLHLTLWGTEFSECRHFLQRTMFAVDKTHLNACLQSESYENYVQALLYKTSRPNETINYTPEIIRPYKKMRDLNITERKAFQKKKRESFMVLKKWWFTQMITTEDPFEEKMVLFWHNHFTSSLRKVRQAALLYKQNALFRKHALGNFAELLHAIIEDPAMLIYLDNHTNKKSHPNENLARELLELFTMGEGNYKETDIQALAKALTGYSRDKDLHFHFKKNIHDNGNKEIFNKIGDFNAHDMINIILEQPATAKFIVRKLWVEFIGAVPDPLQVDKLAKLFVEQNYELKPLLQALFMSEAFMNPSSYGTMIKSPVELTVGTLRSLEYHDFDTKIVLQFCRRLGQDLFDPPNVKGWDGGEQWINTNTLLIRKSFFNRLLRSDTMQYLTYDLFTPTTEKRNKEERAAEVLLPINVFITPVDTFKQTLRMIFQNPIYQLK